MVLHEPRTITKRLSIGLSPYRWSEPRIQASTSVALLDFAISGRFTLLATLPIRRRASEAAQTGLGIAHAEMDVISVLCERGRVVGVRSSTIEVVSVCVDFAGDEGGVEDDFVDS